MCRLFEYAAALADWDTDGRVRAVYAANIEALRVLLPDTAAMEREVMAARAAGVAKSFKTDFKNRVAYPRWKACADKGFERGGKAELIRQLLKSYENAVIAAMRQRTVLHESEQLLSEKTVREWIKEFEIKGKK